MLSSPGSETPRGRLLYTPQEAAELTSFTRDWLVRAASRGEIPHRRYGKRLFRFAHEDLEAIKDMGACPPSPGRDEAAARTQHDREVTATP